MLDPVSRLWIARPPAGVWSSGPEIIEEFQGSDHERCIRLYRGMGWRIDGPYVLAANTAGNNTEV